MRARPKLGYSALLASLSAIAALAPACYAAGVSSVRTPGTLYSVGCATRSWCVAGGAGPGQGQPTTWTVLSRGRAVARMALRTAYGSSVSCPNTRGCVGVAGRDDGGAQLVTFRRGHAPTRTRVHARAGVSFTSIWCAARDRCELAGWDTIDASVAIASWSGAGLGPVRLVGIPSGAGSGDADPRISCAGSWCEVGLNPNPPGGINSNTQQGYLITTRAGRPIGAHWTKGYQIGSISCSGRDRCYAGLITVPTGPPPGTSASYVAALRHGTIGTPHATALTDPQLACHGVVCVGVSSDQIATYRSGVQRSLVSVPTVQAYEGVGIGPGLFFAAVGPRVKTAGSILTTGVA